MSLKSQVCSVEQAIELKNLGIEQISLFHHVLNWRNPRHEDIEDGEHIIVAEERHLTFKKGLERGNEVVFISAFTVGELGMMLPDKFSTFAVSFGDNNEKRYWRCRNERIDTFPFKSQRVANKVAIPTLGGQTEAQARAKMLIHLLKKEFLTKEEANFRAFSINIIWH